MAKVLVEALGRRIRTLREARGWSQWELSKQAKLHLVWIQQVEQGKRANHKPVIPSVATLQKICDALNIPVRDLFESEARLPKEDTLFAKALINLMRGRPKSDKQFLIQMAQKLFTKR